MPVATNLSQRINMMSKDLKNWTPRPKPQRVTLSGRFVRLEPLNVAQHGDALFVAETEGDAEERFRYLYDTVPASRADYGLWLAKAEASEDPLFFVVIDQATNAVIGRQTLMRIDAANGVVEIGNIHWGPQMQRSAKSTEAFYLHAAYVFDDLGYRRFEWKLNNDNAPSHKAALRFGYAAEGVFRQHLVVKGLNRDTAWYAMIDADWPVIKAAFERWLHPDNFDSNGQQIKRLEAIREQLNGGQVKR
jgi:RimJ/RimL family protein N-acetyltransferase